MAARFVDVDYHATFSLVALHGEPERIVAHGYYAEGRRGRAEVAFAVADAFQGRGLGTILLGQLAQAASAAGRTRGTMPGRIAGGMFWLTWNRLSGSYAALI